MRKVRRPVLLTAATALMALLAGAPAAGAGGGLRSLSGEVLHVRGASDLGALSPSRQLIVAITVKHDLSALYRAEWAVYDPKSSTYHHFLTPSQFRRLYGTSPAALAAVRRFGTAHGLTLVNPGALYDYVELHGTAREVERTFGVRIDRFLAPGGQSYYANLQAPIVPARLPIAAVLGLESLSRYHLADLNTHSSAAPRSTAMSASQLAAAQRPWALSSSFGGPLTPGTTTASSEKAARQGGCQSDPTNTESLCTGLLSPQELWNAYDAPGAGRSTPNRTTDFGQGQTIGIIGEGQTIDVITALREFEKTRGLPRVPVQVYHTDPGESAPESTLDDSGRIEWEMDTQSSTGMAPEVSQVRLYFGSSLALTELTGAIGTWVNDPHGPLQASASLGACEDNPAIDPLYGAAQRADQALLIQAAMEGRTLFASAGDTGAGCSAVVSENGIQYGPVPGPEYPAIDPNAVAVGGTILYTTPGGQNALERAWDHTGGAPSKWLPQPPWQAGASPELETNVCPGVYANGQSFPGGGNLCRAGNDVAAESGDITISIDHKVGDVYVPGGYNPYTDNPVQANGFDMVDFCPESEVSSENAAEPDCGYDANGGTEHSYTTDGTTENGVMTDHFSEGGTSLSSPLWLGMWALVQAHHDAGNGWKGAGKPARSSLGLATPLIYALAQGKTKEGAQTTDDFNDITIGANPLPAHPGWDFPTGWGSPHLKNLIADASDTPGRTAPVVTREPSGNDPKPIVASTPGGPSCNYAFYDGDPSAPDAISGNQDPNLALVEGNLGVSTNGNELRVVMTLQNMSESVEQGFTLLDYEFYWNDPSGDSSANNAVDVQIDSLGDVTYEDGTETINSTTGDSFSPSSSSSATGSIKTGPDGTIEVDVPLSEFGLHTGEKLTGVSAYTAEGWGVAGSGASESFLVDQAPSGTYTVGGPTCLDQKG